MTTSIYFSQRLVQTVSKARHHIQITLFSNPDSYNNGFNPFSIVMYSILLYTDECIVQYPCRIEQWNTNQRIAFSVSAQFDFTNPYHACLTCKL